MPTISVNTPVVERETGYPGYVRRLVDATPGSETVAVEYPNRGTLTQRLDEIAVSAAHGAAVTNITPAAGGPHTINQTATAPTAASIVAAAGAVSDASAVTLSAALAGTARDGRGIKRSTAYLLNAIGTAGGYVWQCTTAGTTAASAPAWPVYGAAGVPREASGAPPTVADGTAVWTWAGVL